MKQLRKTVTALALVTVLMVGMVQPASAAGFNWLTMLRAGPPLWRIASRLQVNLFDYFITIRTPIARPENAAPDNEEPLPVEEDNTVPEETEELEPEKESPVEVEAPPVDIQPEPDTDAPTPAPPEESEPTPIIDEATEFEKAVFELVNQERVKAGLKPLQYHYELAKVARDKSQDMADNGYFSHTSPTYGSPFQMIRDYGISWKAAAENIAMGYTSPESAMEGWMNSSGHRKNILSEKYTHIGIGLARNSKGTPYWTQMFIRK